MPSDISSKKLAILSAIERMDTGFLSLLLDNDKIYNEAKKEFFLEKLDEVYEKFKEQNDTSLYRIEGQCQSNACSNKGQCGFAFVGKNSGKHLDLIFEEDETGYKDICQCHDFKSDKVDLKTLCQYNDISLRIERDEEAAFVPTPEYLILSNKCAQAVDEIYKYQDEIMTREIYGPWIEKHRPLYESFEIPLLVFEAAYKKFISIFHYLDEISGYLTHETTIITSLDEYKNINPKDETSMLTFLVHQEDLIDTILMFDYIRFPEDDVPLYFPGFKLRIAAFDYLPIIEYRNTIVDHYYEILDKYGDNLKEEEKVMEMRLEEVLKKSGINLVD